MPNVSDLTESLCPHCLCRVPARRITENNSVFLKKECPTHGTLDKVLLWNNSQYTYSEWSRNPSGYTDCIPDPVSDSSPGCPFSCGICPDHRQDTCTAIIEVTDRCNMHCPVCFSSSSSSSHGALPQTDPKMSQLVQMLQAVIDRDGPRPLQFSGGEPTLRDDLPEIVAAARDMGFDHIQINTNGIRLAQDADYGHALRASGATVVFLQFDGISDDVYRKIRGAELQDLKQRAIERCAELKLGVILVPTLVKGINDSQIGAILHFARDWIPVVKGVHFQPITFLGRYPEQSCNENRILIPDILRAIEEQTLGELKAEHFLPSNCEESHCSFSAFAILGDDGTLIPTTLFDTAQKPGECCDTKAAQQSMNFVRSRWKYNESPLTAMDSNVLTNTDCGSNNPPEGLFNRALSHSLCISGMAFQDVWNIDLKRLRRCCVHVVTPDRNLVPFCAYYLTNSQGERLYPQKT